MNFLTIATFALQSPDGIPKPGNNDPINLQSWSEVIIYVMIPILLIIFYFVWRKNKRNRRD
ncbi:adenylosuccinate synthetase [Joostella atrarenae]|uniref:Adenylosuccinate synthetase n=1 Tax=Joostella atrarenae TaxID=679257 RepID=A0ABS9J3Z6_9FLAO|nr:adenylosuccinate synthetase [Joostella atrarenae]MCF8715147.1 adenylosuccinate synthetase [Joostella atrarenae]